MKNEQFTAVNIIVLGNSTVGKSALHRRYANGEFITEFYSSLPVDFRQRFIDFDTEEEKPVSESLNQSSSTIRKNADHKRVRATFWDPPGSEKSAAFIFYYFKLAHGILLIYDITNRRSFEDLAIWVNEIKENADTAKITVIGNKSDL